VSLAARHLEANGIPTVILGAARDVVENVGVPRFVFTDFPLGNPAGRPYDASMQRAIVEIGLETLETAAAARTTVRTPFVWDETGAWKDEFMQLDPARMEHYRAQGEIRRAIRETVKAAGRLRGWTGGELYKP
jgi:D-proline reductase (dithiol) PrdB